MKKIRRCRKAIGPAGVQKRFRTARGKGKKEEGENSFSKKGWAGGLRPRGWVKKYDYNKKKKKTINEG